MSDAATGPGVTVGDPLAGPDPAGATAGPPGAAEHPHHHHPPPRPLHGAAHGPGEARQRPTGGSHGHRAPARADHTCPTHATHPHACGGAHTSARYAHAPTCEGVTALWRGHVASPDGVAGASWRRRGGA